MTENKLEKGLREFSSGHFKKAYLILLPYARAGNVIAQGYIGVMYMTGVGVKVNGLKAVEWLKKAAKQKKDKISAVAYNNLGTVYITGIPPVRKNSSIAKMYWKKAFELGFTMTPKK